MLTRRRCRPAPTAQGRPRDLQSTLLQVRTQFSEIGRNLYEGTSGLITQVNEAITEEMQQQQPAMRRSTSRIAAK